MFQVDGVDEPDQMITITDVVIQSTAVAQRTMTTGPEADDTC